MQQSIAQRGWAASLCCLGLLAGCQEVPRPQARPSAVEAPLEVCWSDGASAPAPAGLLLSDNLGFYGDIRLTGVTYRYLSALEPGSGDSAEDAPPHRGRRLLNGDIGDFNFPHSDMNPPRLVSPATIEFDFRGPCTFREVDLRLPAGLYRVTLQVGATVQELQTVLSEQPCEVTNPRSMVRLGLSAGLEGRYLVLTVVSDSSKPVALSEVYAWGQRASRHGVEADAAATAATSAALESVPGITRTAVDPDRFRRWVRQVRRELAGPLPPAVWSEVPPWGPLTEAAAPLPDAESVPAPIELTLVRNETEPVALALTNTSIEAAYATEVRLSAFTPAGGEAVTSISGEVMALGALPTRQAGVQLVPLISAANKPGRDVLRRFCTNGMVIRDFPRVALNPAGTLFAWVKITTRRCPAGLYVARLTAGARVSKEIRVQVLDVTLQDSPRFVNYWYKPFAQYPFQSKDWVARDAAHRLEIGITVLPGSLGSASGSLADLMRQVQPNLLFGFWQGQYGGKLWAAGHMGDPWAKDGLTPADIAGIQADARGVAAYAKASGLDSKQWYFDMADEPNSKNLRLFGAVASAMHEAVPEAMISCNPCCWRPEAPHFEPDEVLYPAISGWYEQTIAISLPAVSLLEYPQSGHLFRAPRPFNAHYEVVTQRAKSERFEDVNYPRMLVWKSIAAGFNGWNLFCYYDPPAYDIWDDPNMTSPGFALVYPGPNGPVPTRQFEAAREGFEDYLLMALLRQRDPERHRDILAANRAGTPYSELRRQIYTALAAG